jgi:hypothetical protein
VKTTTDVTPEDTEARTGTRHGWKRSRATVEVLDEFAKKHCLHETIRNN